MTRARWASSYDKHIHTTTIHSTHPFNDSRRGHGEDMVEHEGPNEAGHNLRPLALEGSLQRQRRLVLQQLREEPGSGAVRGCLFGAEQDPHQPIHRSRGHHLRKEGGRETVKITTKHTQPFFVELQWTEVDKGEGSPSGYRGRWASWQKEQPKQDQTRTQRWNPYGM